MEHYVTVYFKTELEGDSFKAMKKSELSSFLELNKNQFNRVTVVDPRNRVEKELTI